MALPVTHSPCTKIPFTSLGLTLLFLLLQSSSFFFFLVGEVRGKTTFALVFSLSTQSALAFSARTSNSPFLSFLSRIKSPARHPVIARAEQHSPYMDIIGLEQPITGPFVSRWGFQIHKYSNSGFRKRLNPCNLTLTVTKKYNHAASSQMCHVSSSCIHHVSPCTYRKNYNNVTCHIFWIDIKHAVLDKGISFLTVEVSVINPPISS